MKKTLAFCFLSCILILGCKRTEGYSCDNGTCKAVSKDAGFEKLADCKKECEDKPGFVTITGKWAEPYLNFTCYKMEIAVAASEADMTAAKYINKSTSNKSPATFQLSLAPGNYYYKVTRVALSTTGCNNGQPVSKADAFVIKPGENTPINVDLK